MQELRLFFSRRLIQKVESVGMSDNLKGRKPHFLKKNKVNVFLLEVSNVA